MAHGKSLIYRALSRYRRDTTPREQRPRDRSLNGKARIKARKAANRVRD